MFSHQDLKNRIKQQPFVPFRVVTSSGQAFDIYHPDLMWIGAREVQIGTPPPDYPGIYDGTTRVAIMHVTALEYLPVQSSPPTKNGPVS